MSIMLSGKITIGDLPDDNDKAEREILHLFRVHAFPEWVGRQNSKQHKGCVIDGRIVHPLYKTQTAEAKNDSYSRRSGNAYIEIAQTSDKWATTSVSGCALCLAKGTDYFIVAAWDGDIHWLLYAPPSVWMDIAKGYRMRETRPNANGNHDGLYANGYIVPIRVILNHPAFAGSPRWSPPVV